MITATICATHDEIMAEIKLARNEITNIEGTEWAIECLTNALDLTDTAKDMGQRMEDALERRKEEVDQLNEEMEILQLKLKDQS